MAVEERGRVSGLGGAICEDHGADLLAPSVSHPPRRDVIDATKWSLWADVPVCERMCI